MITSKRIYFAMVAVIILLIGAIFGATYLVNAQLQKQAAKLTDYKTKAAVLDKEQVGLTQAKKDVEKYSDLEKIAKAIVPQDKDQARAVREIVKIAADSGIKPTSITFPVSTLGGPGGSTSPTSGTVAPKAGTDKLSALSQLTPVPGIKGVYNLQITVQQDAANPVPYTQFIDFLSRLEQNRRTSQVVGIVLQPSANNREMVSFTLTLDEFIKK